MAAEHDLPVTGAWHSGLSPADRKFFDLSPTRPFGLEGGGVLHHPRLAYETWGELDATASNAILVCHALTGDAHAAGEADPPGQLTDGWWDELIGSGLALDTDRYFVVCANTLGGCQGSTGPASINPSTGRRYASDFPVVTIRDLVRSQAALATHLGIERWAAVVGGSMGGMQSLEWAVTYPDRMQACVVMASSTAATPQQIAWSQVGRYAITDDRAFRGGDYYDQSEGPWRGMINARRIAMIHYRSAEEFDRRFGRTADEELMPFRTQQRFNVESYLDYAGEKFVRRFDANSYIALNKSMDLHDIARGRGDTAKALSRVKADTLVMSVRTDFLYPRHLQMEIVDALLDEGVRVEHVDIDSDNGHDGFLTAHSQTGPVMGEFIDEVFKRTSASPS